ncbi:MAG: hypothetical protein NVV73_05090 [Cellvibrionaceae bacterium]|nr:hypothetical protein [Cellvibrionaceae bacterium]
MEIPLSPGSGKKPIQPNTDDAAAMKAEIKSCEENEILKKGKID